MINDVWRNKKTKKLYFLICECDIGSQPGYVYFNTKDNAFYIKKLVKFNEEFELINASLGNVKFVNILEEVRFK